MIKFLLSAIFLIFFIVPAFSAEEDAFILETLQNKNIEKPFEYTDYDYSSTVKIPINLRITDEIKTENDLYEGQIINFIAADDVKYNGKLLIKSGSKISARVETIIENGMNGIPASIILGDFKIPNIESKQLTFYYERFGFDLSLFVYPIKWLLTPLPPTGSLTNFIKGGHVKINKNTKITIYYYPI